MFHRVSEKIAECHAHAARARDVAKRAQDSKLKQDFLDAERTWLALACSREYVERLTNFIKEAMRYSRKK
jgi:hypothetical protein